MGTLTVKENLMFSANLRLPPSTTTEERARRVDETIAELGLTECQNSKVSFSPSLPRPPSHSFFPYPPSLHYDRGIAELGWRQEGR